MAPSRRCRSRTEFQSQQKLARYSSGIKAAGGEGSSISHHLHHQSSPPSGQSAHLVATGVRRSSLGSSGGSACSSSSSSSSPEVDTEEDEEMMELVEEEGGASSGESESPATSSEQPQKSSPSSSPSADSEEFEVEKVVGVKHIGGLLHYHIKWTGYPVEENTWEPVDNLSNAIPKIRDFQRECSKKKVKVICDQARKVEKVRRNLLQSSVLVKRVIAYCPKEEAKEQVEDVAVEFANGMIISISEEEIKMMMPVNRKKIEEEIDWQNKMAAVRRTFEGGGKRPHPCDCSDSGAKKASWDTG